VTAQALNVSGLAYAPRWALLVAVFCGHAALALVYDALPPILVQLAAHFGGGATGAMVAQFASSLPFFGIMLAGLIAPSAIRLWGIRGVLLSALVLFGLLGTAGAFINEAWALLLTRFMLGLAVGTMVTCCVSSVALNFEGDTRARMTGWLLAFGCLSGVILILVSGYVASWYGWRAPFFLHGVISLIFVVPVLLMTRGKPAAAPQERFSGLSRLRPVAPVFGIAFCLQGLAAIFLIQLAFLIGTKPFGTPEVISQLFAITGIAASAIVFAYSRWLVRVSPQSLVVIGLALVSGGFIVAALAGSFAAFAACAILHGSGSALTQASLFNWAMQKTPADLTARTMGLMFTCLYFGAAVVPAITATLPIVLGIQNLFLIVAGVTLGALVIIRTSAVIARVRT
jgi:MFS family permease